MNCLVIGGGLAGLSTAALLTAKGHNVKVIEKMAVVGGRATTLEKDGFLLNFGAHGLYGRDRSSFGKVLETLQLNLNFAESDPDKLKYEIDHQLFSIPSSAGSLWKSTLFEGLYEKSDFIKAITTILISSGKSGKGLTLIEWLDTKNIIGKTRDFILHLAHSNFFTPDYRNIDAEQFLKYYKRMFRSKHPISYVIGGWSRIVEELSCYIEDHGGSIDLKKSVSSIVFEGNRCTGVMVGKLFMPADQVILAIPPKALKRVVKDTPIADKINEQTWEQPSSTVFVYDVALDKKIRGDVSYINDTTNGAFITDPSHYDPTCVPSGKQLLQIIMYTSESDYASEEAKSRLTQVAEGLLDRHFSGWRDSLLFNRVVEQAVVQGVRPGKNSYPLPLEIKGLDGVYFAGDWCEGDGSVSDVAFNTALQVTEKIDAVHQKAKSHAS